MDLLEVLEECVTEGNPGAIAVVSEAIERDYSNFALISAWCTTFNKRGPNLWEEYKKANKDIDRLLDKMHRDLPNSIN